MNTREVMACVAKLNEASQAIGDAQQTAASAKDEWLFSRLAKLRGTVEGFADYVILASKSANVDYDKAEAKP